MNKNILLSFACFLLASVTIAQAQEAPATRPSATSAPAVDQGNPTDLVQKRGPRAEQFLQKHNEFLARTKQPVDLLFLGDSITAGWATQGKDVWAQRYADLNAANFGIGGDMTQHVLWRIHNGELENIKPKVVVLMIGTNNTARDASEEIAAGVTKIVEDIRSKLPESKVLLLAVFPRSRGNAEQTVKIGEINTIIAKLDDGKMIRFLDIGGKFLDANGTLPKEVMPDGLHPNKKGYEIWADAMAPLLDEMMK
jgi:lysophospholipase L1-like esterase